MLDISRTRVDRSLHKGATTRCVYLLCTTLAHFVRSHKGADSELIIIRGLPDHAINSLFNLLLSPIYLRSQTKKRR